MNKTPKLRFKEFSGEWEERKFSSIFSEIKNKTSDTITYPLYSLTIENGVEPKSERYEREFLVTKNEDNFKIVNKDEFVYNPMNLRFGALARHKENKAVSVSGYYNIFKIINSSPASFWDHYLKTNRMMYIYNTIATGSLIEKRRVHFSQFIELNLPMPDIKEQEKIASFFSLIDNKISLQSEKVEMLKEYKKGMMQKIFSRELRFKDDSGRDYPEWEEKKLGDIANLTSSKRVFASDYVDEGIPFYRGKEITELKQNKKPKDILYITEERYNDIKNKFGIPIKGDLLLTAVGTLGNSYVINDDKPFYFKDGNLIWFKDIKEDVNFLNFALTYERGKKKIIDSAIGSTQKALTIVELNKLKFKFPSLDEQLKISSFFNNIDLKILKEEEKLDSLNEYKKGLLQQMFV